MNLFFLAPGMARIPLDYFTMNELAQSIMSRYAQKIIIRMADRESLRAPGDRLD